MMRATLTPAFRILECGMEILGKRQRAKGGRFGNRIVDGSISLGMRRLSIIDLEGGHQPIFNEDGKVGVVLNGEIYNFQELQQQLIDRGHSFRTRSDSEVVAHSYEEWGADCVERFQGMFAIAVYDRRASRSSELRRVRALGVPGREAVRCFWRAIGWELSRFTTTRKARSFEFRVPSFELKLTGAVGYETRREFGFRNSDLKDSRISKLETRNSKLVFFLLPRFAPCWRVGLCRAGFREMRSRVISCLVP